MVDWWSGLYDCINYSIQPHIKKVTYDVHTRVMYAVMYVIQTLLIITKTIRFDCCIVSDIYTKFGYATDIGLADLIWV